MSVTEAETRAALAADPNNLRATSDLALLLLGRGALAEAESQARNAVRLAPGNPQSHNLMGLVMTEAGRAPVGEYHYRRALALLGRDEAVTLANLAWNLRTQGRIAEARALYERASALGPPILQTLLGWARTEEADRDFARAMGLIEKAAALAPGDPAVAQARALILARQGQTEAALAIFEALNREGASDPAARSETGRLLDRLGRHDEAFAAFAAGKALALKAGAPPYRAAAAAEQMLRLKAFFTPGRLATLPRAATRTDLPQPIFITGFPRSGTTMVEQMLSAHPHISAGDELPFIGDIAAALPRLLGVPLAYPEALAELWMGDQREAPDLLRDLYLTRARQSGAMRAGAVWFTDKMPLNETHLGLIHLLLPASPVIHLWRHPLDVVLSVYAHHLTHGFFCAAALESAARHYALAADLAAHYQAAVQLRIVTLRYEDIVDRPEQELRRLLGFLGVAFDPACLRFEENRRLARSASHAQVTEPLHARGRYRYRHYMRHLEPVLPILKPAMRRIGYTVSG